MNSSGIAKLAKTVGRFLLGQSGVQGLNLVTGFCVLRWMSVASYAQFSVAIAFQSLLVVLVDLGFSGSIVALIGPRGDDPDVVGRYVRSARHYRSKTFLLLAGASLVVFPIVTAHQPWPWTVKLLLLSSVVSAVFFQGLVLYSAPLLIHGRLNQYYRAGFASSGFRFGVAGALHVVSLLQGWVYSWISAVSIAIMGWMYRRYSTDLLKEPEEVGQDELAEMRRYLVPLWPGLIFTAFQGQVTVGVVTMLGTTGAIAQVAALGRIGQIFTVLSAVNVVLVEPMFARLDRDKLMGRYVAVLLLGTAAVAPLVLLSYVYPQPFLWLLGAKYKGLDNLVVIVMLNSAFSFIGGLAWTINYTRKWVTWRYTGIYIATVVLFQVVGVFLFDLSQAKGVLLWSMGATLAMLIAHAVIGAVKAISAPTAPVVG